MTLEEFKKEVLDAANNRESWSRFGQAVFNYIDYHYGVARKVQFFDNIDCFFNDDKVDDFITHSYYYLNN